MKEYIYKLHNTSIQIDTYVSIIVWAKIPKLELDEVFTSKEEIAQAGKSERVHKMEEFGYCIQSVLVTDVNSDAKVKLGMNENIFTKQLCKVATNKAQAAKFMQVEPAEFDNASKFLHLM